MRVGVAAGFGDAGVDGLDGLVRAGTSADVPAVGAVSAVWVGAGVVPERAALGTALPEPGLPGLAMLPVIRPLGTALFETALLETALLETALLETVADVVPPVEAQPPTVQRTVTASTAVRSGRMSNGRMRNDRTSTDGAGDMGFSSRDFATRQDVTARGMVARSGPIWPPSDLVGFLRAPENTSGGHLLKR